jgi:ribosomal protein S14
MGTTIELVTALRKPETTTRKGVTCIFCGLATAIPASGPGKFASHVPRSNPRVSIVRCEICGKEAPYPIREILEFRETSRVQDL